MHSTHPPRDFVRESATDISSTRELLALLLVIVALGALSGGLCGILGASGLSRVWLVGTPFESYLVPGAILIVTVGGSSLTASALVVSRARLAALVVVAATLLLLVFAGATHRMVGHVSVLPSLLVVVAALQLVLAVRLGFEERRTVAARSERRHR